MERLSDKARIYARSYKQFHYGREIEGTAELLLQMADKLAEYEDLEEQGKLLKLPCEIKKRNTFYAIIESKIIHLKINDCKINPYCGGIDIYCINTDNKCDYRWIHLPNKNIFLTKELAEAALKEMSE